MHAVSPRILAILVLAIAVVGAQGMMVSPLLPDVAAALNTGVAEIGYALGAYGLATAVSALVAARFLDLVPRRRAIGAGMGLLSLALGVCAVAANALWLGAGQVFAGVAAGILLPTVYAYAGDIAPEGMRARIVARALLGWSIALAAAIPLGGFLGALIGWRGVFAVMALACVAVAGAAMSLPRVPRVAVPAPSYAGSLSVPGIRPALMVPLANMTGFYAMYSYLGAAIRAEHGGGPGLAALAVLAYGIGFTLAQPLARGIDRVGPARAMVAAMALLSGLFVLLPHALPLFALFCLAICAVGVVQHVALNTIVSVISAASAERRASVLALNTSMTYVGVLVGAASMGPVFERSGFVAVTTFSAACLAFGALVALRVVAQAAPR